MINGVFSKNLLKIYLVEATVLYKLGTYLLSSVKRCTSLILSLGKRIADLTGELRGKRHQAQVS